MAHTPAFLGCLETLLNTNLEELNMSTPRNETREILETITLGGVAVNQVKVSYDYKPWSRDGDSAVERVSYDRIEVDDGSDGLDGLNKARIVLEALAQLNDDEFSFAGHDHEYLTEILEETASEIAEELEIHFIYDRNGQHREYTPRSLWQPSGGCEWEESATEYDYGWDL